MKINRRMFLAGSASAAALAALAACSGSDSSSSATAVKLDGSDLNPQDRDALQDGGSLTIPIGQIIPNFNPLQMDGNLQDNASTLNLFISPANWVYAEDATFTARPEFCKEFTSEEKDGKTVVTLTLNPDARWNNGSPITWADYEATWKACNGEDEAFKAVVATTDGYNHIESVVQGVDEYQVVITFKAIFPDWGTVTGSACPPACARTLTPSPTAGRTAQSPTTQPAPSSSPPTTPPRAPSSWAATRVGGASRPSSRRSPSRSSTRHSWARPSPTRRSTSSRRSSTPPPTSSVASARTVRSASRPV